MVAKHGTKAEASRQAGININTLKHQVTEGKRRGMSATVAPPSDNKPLLDMVDRLQAENARLKQEVLTASRPHFTVRHDSVPKTEKCRVVVIGDAHDSPGLSKDRFWWMSKYIRKQKPDYVIQIGDFANWDSLSVHTKPETYEGRSKPLFTEDLSSFREALDALDCGGVEHHCTLGNHERRIYIAENNAPQTYGIMQFELGRMLERYKWTFSPYGEIYYLGGVGFVHAAINKMGKTFGGLNAEQTIANHSLHDLVIGHSHVDRKHRAPKIGNNKEVQIINVGCSLPQGHVESYAQHSQTGWSFGIADLTIQHGHVRDYQFISMERLKELHG